MPIQTTTIKVFIGGPQDTKEDRAEVVNYIENELARRLPSNVKLEADCFDHPKRPVGVQLEDDWQENIDRAIVPGSQDFGIIIFRWTLGKDGERNGREYPSMSVYEIEQFLASGRPLAIFRYDQPYDYKSRLPENFVLLPVEQQQKIAATLKKEQEEYERLTAYLRNLTTQLRKTAIPRFRDRDQLLRLVDETLPKVIGRIQENMEKGTFVDNGKQPPPPGWPFFSFRSLEEEHNGIFFGREDAVRLILDDLKNPELQFLCIHGCSGTGKSSLLKAGILPALVFPELAARNGIKYYPGTVHVVFNPDDRPFEKLADRISQCKGTLLRGCDSTELADRLMESCQGEMEVAIDGVRKWLIDPALAGSPKNAQLILVIDQAEELWTRTGDERRSFLLFLAAMVHHSQVRILSALRSDLHKNFTEFELISRLFNQKKGEFHILNAPDEGMLAKMIEGPLRVAGIKRDDDLIGAILGDARKIGGDALPLVAHTLSIMVSETRDGQLTLDSYRKIGRLEGAVQAALGRAGRIPPGQLPPLFDLLYEIRAGAPVRRLVSRREIEDLNVDVSAAIDRLIKARILVAGVSDKGSGDAKMFDNVQLAHDALFEVWPELREWVRQYRRDLEIRDELLRDAERWEFRGRRSRYIRLRPEALDEVLSLDREKPYLFGRTPVIGRYLQAANELRLRELLIEYLKGRHLGSALDTYLKGGRLTKEDRGADPNQLVAAFHAAVTGDDRVDEEFLLPGGMVMLNYGPSVYDRPENVNTQLSGGLVPLEVASMFGHFQVVRKLIERGADPNRKSPGSGATALGLAAYGGHLDIVRHFIEECHSDADERDNDNGSPLIWALNRGHDHVVSYLLEHGAQLDIWVKDRETRKDAWNAVTEAVRGGSLTLVQQVMERLGTDANFATEIGATPLSVACRSVDPKYVEVAEYLVKKGAKINGGESGWKPLAVAAHAGFAEMMRFLLNKGADPNLTDEGENAPLHFAAGLPSSLPARLLLEHHANPNEFDKDGSTPLVIAALSGRDEIVELLLNGGADPDLIRKGKWNALQLAAYDGDAAIVRLLLNKGATTEKTTPDGWTPVLLAARMGNAETVALLLQHGADPNRRVIGPGPTALHIAVENRHEAITALLLSKGGSPNILLSDGTSPLDVAAAIGDVSACALLLDHNAQFAATRKDGLSALHLAAMGGSELTVKLFLERGAEPAVPAVNGKTPKQIAAAGGHTSIVKLLTDAGATEQTGDDTNQLGDERFVPVLSGEDQTAVMGSWEALSDAEEQQVLADSRELLETFTISQQVVIRMSRLPFYENVRLISITDENRAVPNRLRLLWKVGTANLLDWKNESIYQTNKSAFLELTPANVAAYTKFFFGNVHGQLGQFDIVETQEEIPWTNEATVEERARVAELLEPLRVRGFDEYGRYVLTGTVVFKNALFRTNVRIAPHAMCIFNARQRQMAVQVFEIGQLELTDEELLLEELNVRIDPPPISPWV